MANDDDDDDHDDDDDDDVDVKTQNVTPPPMDAFHSAGPLLLVGLMVFGV